MPEGVLCPAPTSAVPLPLPSPDMPHPHARYYRHKLHAAEKEQRTIQASAQVGYLATTSCCITSAPPLVPHP